jgi:hypothetical protein
MRPDAVARINGLSHPYALVSGQVLSIPAVPWTVVPPGPVCNRQIGTLPVTTPFARPPVSTTPWRIDTPLPQLTPTPSTDVPTPTLTITPTITPGPSPSPAPAVIKFWADAYDIELGRCTTLRWELVNVEAASLTEGQSGSQPITDFFGAQDACPKTTTLYTLQAVLLDKSQEIRSVTINVRSPAPPTQAPAVIKFWADAYDVELGRCTTLRWTLENVEAATLTEGQSGSRPITNFFGAQDACPKTTTLYTLQAVLSDKSQEIRSVTINVRSPAPPTQAPTPTSTLPASPLLLN